MSALDSLGCWYGFVYTCNYSHYKLRETMKFELEGLEIAETTGKAYSSDTVELDLEPNEEHIVILRRTEGSCTYGLSRITRNRELTD